VAGAGLDRALVLTREIKVTADGTARQSHTPAFSVGRDFTVVAQVNALQAINSIRMQPDWKSRQHI